MRKKKNLVARLSAVDNLINVDTSIKNVNEAILDKRIIDLKSEFDREADLFLEVGCGKGGFISQIAKLHPENNYVAIEMIENIIVMAMEKVKKENLTNVKFLNIGAEYLPRYFEDNSVKGIYLNFSPPYPQNSYECRRLTNERFIKTYDRLLTVGGFVEQKTDDKGFFDYSKETFAKLGFEVTDLSLTLLNDKNNVVTEYESKFLAQGLPIYKLIAKKSNKNT